MPSDQRQQAGANWLTEKDLQRAVHGVPALLAARERLRRDALVADDMATLAGLVTDDIVHVHTTGIVHGKSELLDHAGRFLKFYEVERGPLQIRMLASNVAVMTGSMTNTVGRRGLDERLRVYAFVTQVWIFEDKVWRIASFHAVRKPDT